MVYKLSSRVRREKQSGGPLVIEGGRQEEPSISNNKRRSNPFQRQKRSGRHRILLISSIILLSLFSVVYLKYNSFTGNHLNLSKSLRHNHNKNNDNDMPAPPRKVFVDLGANCGNTYLKRRNKFEKEGGWEIYLWEPSPQMHEFFLNDLANQNPSIAVLPYAAGVGQNTTIQLYVHKGQERVTQKKQFRDGGKCNPRSPYNPSGGSTIFGNAKVAGKPVDVQKVNFPEWLERVGLGLRPGVDQFLFKIDIEGAEVEIMEELLSPPLRPDAPVCAAEHIEMEFHKGIFKEGTDDYKRHEKFEEDFMTMFEAKCGRLPKLRKLA
jgi:FkbM family methyltransferase